MTTPPQHPQVPGRVLARIGTAVGGKYRIDRLIGVGGMGAVYAATHRNGHRVAIKFLHERFDDQADMRALFSREAHLANDVGHPGAVPVIDDDVDDAGSAFLVMPLLEGETLRARWERAGKHLHLAEVAVLMADALDVLASAHAKGIVHRDVKPENIFVTRQGQVRILDFGIARRTDSDGSATVTGAMIGTPAFMPPEQALGNRHAIGAHSDCWAMGATIFALLSGEVVHVSDNAGAQLVATATRHARSLGEVAPGLPMSIVRFVDKALAFRPEERWANAAEMRMGLLAAFDEALGASILALTSVVRAKVIEELESQADAPPSAWNVGRGEPRTPGEPWQPPANEDIGPTLLAAEPRTPVSPMARRPSPPWEITLTHGYTLGAPKSLLPTGDGRIVLFLRARPRDAKQSLWETDLATGQTRELLRPEELHAGPEMLSDEERDRRERQRITAMGFTSFQATRDGGEIVVTSSGRLYVFARASGEVRELRTGPGPALDPQLSPDGTRVAYVRDYDVYTAPLDGGPEIRVTHGGTEVLAHGLAEFIAQEELRRSRGFWWSPDGDEILYEEADIAPVQRLTLSDPTHPEKPPSLRPYPRAGTPNAIVRLAIAKVPAEPAAEAEPATTRHVTWDNERYPYLATVTWTANAPPTIYVLDRPQRRGLLLAVDPATGATRTLLAEEDADWLNADPSVPRWREDGRGFLWSTERRGGWELEARNADGSLRATCMPAALGYRELLAIDEANAVAYVTACSDPIRAEIWAAPLEGDAAPHPVARLAEGVVHGHFGPTLDAEARAYAFSEATMQGERRFGARALDGSFEVAIPSAAEALPCALRVEYTTVGNDAFHVAIVRPRDFEPRRRYPVLDSVYGGPHNNVVTADAAAYLRHQWIADVTGAIVVAIDVQGTMWRGRAWERTLRDRVGDVPLEGHVAALHALAERYPEMDLTRAGIYGRSFGGYLTAMAILRHPEIYKVGVAASPTVDLADYDTCYTERYLGMPPNRAYENASLLTWASRPPSPTSPARPFLLVHGTVDDNVHFANALKLAATMGNAGRPVEFVPLVGVAHMMDANDIAGPTWTRIAHFLRDHL